VNFWQSVLYYTNNEISTTCCKKNSCDDSTMKHLLRKLFFWDAPAQVTQGSLLTTSGEKATSAECSIVVEYPSAYAAMPGMEMDICAKYRWFRFRYDFPARVIVDGVQRNYLLRRSYFGSRLWLFDDFTNEEIFWRQDFLSGSSFRTIQGEKIGELKTALLTHQEMVLHDCRCNSSIRISLVKSLQKSKEYKALVPSGFDYRLLLFFMVLEFDDDIYSYTP